MNQYWIGIKDEQDKLVIGIPFQMANAKTLMGAKREATKRLNAYVPPSDLLESAPVAYIATGMNRRMSEWKKIAKKDKKWVAL